jgi:precorrin-6B methylase 2
MIKFLFLSLILFTSPAWSDGHPGSCGDLTIAKLQLTPAQLEHYSSYAYTWYFPERADLALTTTQIRNFRIQMLSAIERHGFSGIYESRYAEHVISHLFTILPPDLNFSLQLFENLGRQKWIELLDDVTTRDFINEGDALHADRILFALPNREIELVGKTRQRNVLDARGAIDGATIEIGSWLDLPTQNYNTSYQNLKKGIEELNLPDGSMIVDMGSGLGRMGFVVGSYFPKLKYVGYEYHGFRMNPGKETATAFGFDNVQFIQADFSSPELNLLDGDVFYFYYPNNNSAVMTAALEKVHRVAMKKKIRVICNFALGVQERLLPWLRKIERNTHGFSVYESQ